MNAGGILKKHHKAAQVQSEKLHKWTDKGFYSEHCEEKKKKNLANAQYATNPMETIAVSLQTVKSNRVKNLKHFREQ